MNIKVLGSGCANCNKLEALVMEVVSEMGIEATFEHVTDFAQIARYGVMSTPALVIDEEVKISGLVPSKAKVNEIVITELAKRG